MGPPKHAESAITGNPRRATVMSATRSPSELPTAKIVSPRMASLILRTTPSVFRTPTTSFAILLIHEMLTTKPTKQRRTLQRGGRVGVVVERRSRRMHSETTAE
jgi:hypothetical protein